VKGLRRIALPLAVMLASLGLLIGQPWSRACWALPS